MQEVVNQFITLITESLTQKTFVKISCGKPSQKGGLFKKVTAKVVSVKGVEVLSFAKETATQTTTLNLPFEECEKELLSLIGKQFKNINLFTTQHDHILMFSKKMIPRLQQKPATFTETKTNSHNREKRRYISVQDNIYLAELGVTTTQGDIVHSKQNKFKQINKFVEVLDSLIQSSPLIRNNAVTIADMGSGKGYLTFALYDYLKNELKLNPIATGIEFRENLVAQCNTIAQKSGFDSLSFIPGSIQGNPVDAIDILIALHACDTATDDAIYQGIQANASIIVTAPCCHKQIRKEMEVTGPLQDLTRHGILKERQAEMVTDTIRALLLEAHGYRTQIFEFIADAHTHKNVMITAVKRTSTPKASPILDKVSALKQLFGIKTHYLETLLFRPKTER